MHGNEVELANVPAALLFAGYMIPYDELGQTYEFNILSIPCSHGEMQPVLADIIQGESWNEERIMTQPAELIFDTDLELLQRGKGIRIWLVSEDEFVGMVLGGLNSCLSEENEFRFKKCVDRIATEPPTLEIKLQAFNNDLIALEEHIRSILKIPV